MKNYLALLLCLLPFIVFAQSADQNQILKHANQYAFVNKVRIDSIQALYAQLNISDDIIVTASLSYGQNKSLFSNALRNGNGELLSFDSIAALLNLLDYNGWEPYSGLQLLGKSNNIILVMKRKKQS
jgi:hypothetical protein